MNNNETIPCVFPVPYAHRERIEAMVMRSLRRFAEFEASVNDWYRNGDGRSVADGGKGHRYPVTCVHGSPAYVDYDAICGPCEGGYGYWDYARELVDAAREVRYAYSVSDRRREMVFAIIEEGGLPMDVTSRIFEWAFKPIDDLKG